MAQQKKSWIESLYQQSWEMELLISGFVLVILFTAMDQVFFVYSWLNYSMETTNTVARYISMMLTTLGLFSNFVLILILSINLALRGYWIALVGLLSASNKSKFEQPFSQHSHQNRLQKNEFYQLESHTHAIDKLGSQCFAVAILYIGYVLSLVALLVISIVIGELEKLGFSSAIHRYVQFVFILLSAIFLLDLFSVGVLSNRKSRWLNVPNYYIYRFFRVITGYFLYEKTALNLRVSGNLKIVNLAFIAVLVGNTAIQSSVNRSNFDDYTDVRLDESFQRFHIEFLEGNDSGRYITDVVLDKQVFHQMPVRVMLPLTATVLKELSKHCDLENQINVESDCINQVVDIQLNDKAIDLPDWFSHKPRMTPSKFVATMIDMPDLPRGKHVIAVKLKNLPEWQKANIWYYPENN